MKGTIHPHKNVIDNYKNIYPMISLIDESKMTYVREKLQIHLHASQIKLLKEAKKHSKQYHKDIRINKYKNLEESIKTDKIFEMHIKLFINKYKKLENKGLVKVDTELEELPYDVTITPEGEEILQQITQYEAEWEDIVLEGIEDKEKLLEQIKTITNNASPITYKHKKQQKFLF